MNKTTTIVLESDPLTDKEVEALYEQPLDSQHYDRVIGGKNTYVFTADRSLLLVYLPQKIQESLCGPATKEALRRAAKVSQRRGKRRSGTVGYLDRDGSCNYCRLCRFNRDDPDGWRYVWRILKAMDGVYSDEQPGVYDVQSKFVKLTHPD